MFRIETFHLDPAARAKAAGARDLAECVSGRCDMKMRGAAFAACFLMISIAQAAAQGQGVLGQGNVSCRTWSADRSSNSGEAMARVGWVLGYITAFNEYGSKAKGEVSVQQSTEQIVASVDDHCKQHPDTDLYRASAALVDKFSQRTGR